MLRRTTSLIPIVACIFKFGVIAQTNWTVYEETYLAGTITGTIQQGHIFQTASGSIYEVVGVTIQVVVEVYPKCTVLQSGNRYRLMVEGFEEPLLCRQLAPPGGQASREENSRSIQSTISGEFEGWNGSTVFILDNGQVWQQAVYDYLYHYAYRPNVLIYETGGGYKMRVEGVKRTIYVKRLK